MKKKLNAKCTLCGCSSQDEIEQEYIEEQGVCFVCEDIKNEELREK